MAAAVAERVLQIAEGLSVPIDVVTEAIAILAKRRVGKSYTARKIVEQLLGAGLQVVIVDPKSDWWGLRSSADGKRPGYPILIAGGEHGDVPIESGAGEVLARFVVEQRVNLLLDLSGFRKSEVAVFMAAFLETLYRLKAREQYRTPMMLVVDEADAIGPQRPQKGEERMLGAYEDVVRRGGQRGIGSLSISQRAAVLNKNVLNMAQVLIVLRTLAPQDLAAMDSWIEVHGTPEQRRVLFETLPSLPVGDAWVWSPGWPTEQGIFLRVHIGLIETYDSGASPKVGQKITPPKSLADVDLGALKEAMAATIERAKADDPRLLRRRILELERDLERARRGSPTDTREVAELRIAQAALTRRVDEMTRELSDARETVARMELGRDQRIVFLRELQGDLLTLARRIGPIVGDPPEQAPDATREAGLSPHRSKASLEPLPPASPPNPPRPSKADRNGKLAVRPVNVLVEGASDVRLGKGERTVMSVLAQYPGGRTYNELAFLAGYSAKASTLGVILANLRRLGYVTRSGDPRLTDEGQAAAGPTEGMPTGPALLAYWRQHPRMGAGERKVLDVLIEAFPAELSNDELCERAGYSPTASTMGVILSKLRKLGLVEKNARRVAHEFMDAISSAARR